MSDLSEIEATLLSFARRGAQHLSEKQRQTLRKYGYIQWSRISASWSLTETGARRVEVLERESSTS